MHIFVDESGTFARGRSATALSVVGAIVIPSFERARLFKSYARLRTSLPKERGEVKGRLLSETQVASAINLLRRASGLFEAVVIDAHGHSEKEFEDYRRRAAEGFTRRLTDEHHPNVVAAICGLRDELLRMNEQQFLQAQATFVLLAQVSEIAVNYFALRRPQELGSFYWTIDAKDRVKETDWEVWWRKTMLPWLQSHSLHTPLGMYDGGDYSHFAKYSIGVPEYLEATTDDGIDLNLLLTENFEFSSATEPGLELADIATNALRRSLVGHLQQPAWQALRSVMVHRRGGCVKYATIGLERDFRVSPGTAPHFFLTGGRNMLTRSHYSDDDD